MSIRIAAVCALLLLSGCDKPEPVDIIQPQREAMDKAKGVEEMLQRDADEKRKRIEEAERQ